ncbi:MAG TPA: FAD-dependent monooxygenase [Actinomycetes bacterium]|nr:FAD-dependent monooxygenase [Actinomycetes bacterium]
MGFPDLDRAAAHSPTLPAAVPQDHLEPVLLGHLQGFPATGVRFGTELAAFAQDAGGVTVTLRERATGAERLVRAATWSGPTAPGTGGCTAAPGTPSGSGWRTTPTPA